MADEHTKADYRAAAQRRKALAMAHLLIRFPEPPEPHELLSYGDAEWLHLQQTACPWLRDGTRPPSDTTRDVTAAEYLRAYTNVQAGRDPFPNGTTDEAYQ